MVEEIVGGLFKGLARIIGQIFFEVVFELLIKGPGHLISKLFTKRAHDPDGFVVVVTGFAFWLVIGGLAYYVFSNAGATGNA